ncbi:MAG: HEAT repeat domain-containing protein [Planctomycetes bacterium]|nr:HEAT repeat domain-containing protein [Planctomycetota bacterium]
MLRQILPSILVLTLLAGLTQFVRADDKPSDDLVKLIIKLIGDPDREFRAAGLEKVRSSAKGAAATHLFAAQLTKLDAAGQIALLSALADRRDATARAAVLELLGASQDEQVRASSILALGTLGGIADLPLLVKSLSASGPEQAAARRSLVQMSGDTVNKSLAAELKTATPHVKNALIDVLSTRRATDESPALVAATVDDAAQVRSAAMSALGQIGSPDQISALLPGVLKAQKGGERDHAERSVAMICSRIDNEDERGTRLIEALNTIPPADRDELLPLVGRVGGKKLINFVGDIASEQDPARRKFGIDALSKWPDASVADKLLEIANKTADPAERNQAFQGYVKIAATRDNRSDRQRLDRMKQAMKAARSPEEQLLVINRTRTAYDVEAVRFVQPYLEDPEFAQLACETIVEIAHHREVRDPHKAEFDKILDKVIAVSKDAVVVDRAQRYKRGETWERPKK